MGKKITFRIVVVFIKNKTKKYHQKQQQKKPLKDLDKTSCTLSTATQHASWCSQLVMTLCRGHFTESVLAHIHG